LFTLDLHNTMARTAVLVAVAVAAVAAVAAASGLYGAKGSSVVLLDEKNFQSEVIDSQVRRRHLRACSHTHAH
jgi:hypothetical protein